MSKRSVKSWKPGFLPLNLLFWLTKMIQPGYCFGWFLHLCVYLSCLERKINMKNVVTDWEIQTVAHQLLAATVLQESALIHCT
jgi:hypothetical protein